jgi:hypothetical protein
LQPEQRVLLLGVLRSLVDSEKTDGEKPAK